MENMDMLFDWQQTAMWTSNTWMCQMIIMSFQPLLICTVINIIKHSFRYAVFIILYSLSISDVNKDWTHKDKDHSRKDKDKDLTCKDKDKDLTYKDSKQKRRQAQHSFF